MGTLNTIKTKFFAVLVLLILLIGYQNCSNSLKAVSMSSSNDPFIEPPPPPQICDPGQLCVRITSPQGASPLLVDSISEVQFAAEASDGVEPYSYFWSNCTPVENEPDQCSKLQSGNPGDRDLVSVTVRDHAGKSATAEFNIIIRNRITPPPVDPKDEVIAIEMGVFNSCTIMKDNSLKCWGSNFRIGNGIQTGYSSKPVKVQSLSNVIQVSISDSHTCVVLIDKTVKCWGQNNEGQLGNGNTQASLTPVSVTSLNNVKMVAVGSSHSCAVIDDTPTNSVKCWGSNGNGQLGTGTEGGSSPTPTLVTGLSNVLVTSISTSGLQTCVVLADKTAKCWGPNSSNEILDGYRLSSPTPVTISGLSNVKMISVGGQTCALLDDSNKTVLCRGRVFHGGDLGNRHNIRPNSTEMTPVLTGAESISSGSEFGCALLTNKSVKCWGWNDFGQLGSSLMTQHNSPNPVTVEGLTDVEKLSAGGTTSCALRSNKTVQCWGEHSYIPNSATAASANSVYLGGSNSMLKLSPGRRHSCAIYNDGATKCWGMNEFGQLGNGMKSSITKNPVLVQGLSNTKQVSLGEYHTCALSNDGTVKCWGWNSFGQLGTGNTQDSLAPVAVSGLSDVEMISSGTSHNCALLRSGTVKCWGWNSFGQLGNNNTNPELHFSTTPVSVVNLQSVTAISGSLTYTCALLADQTVKCWGKNTDSFSGNGSIASSPILISNLNNVERLSVGAVSCAILQNKTVKCWGENSSGELGNGNYSSSLSSAVDVQGLSNVEKISVGPVHACAQLSNKTIKCWGDNHQNQLGPNMPANNSNVPVEIQGIQDTVDVYNGWNSTCAKVENYGIKCWGWNAFYQLRLGPESPRPIEVSFAD